MWRHVSCAVLSAVMAFGCGVEEESDETESTESEIIGGSLDNGHPAVVAVTFQSTAGSFICTGTLITPTAVVTAAHCLLPSPGHPAYTNWQVAVGSSVSSAAIFPVVKAYPHPEYQPGVTGVGNDAAVLLLGSPVNGIRPLAFNRRPLGTSLEGQNLTLVGYGNDNGQNGTGNGVKRTATVRITDVRNEELDAGMPGRTTCQGDSGGPWLMRRNRQWVIVGLTAYGPVGCTDAGSATRVDRVADFVMSVLERA
jgi:secreted trypsin-like serine protease